MKDPGFAGAIRGVTGLLTDLVAIGVKAAAEVAGVVGDLHDFFAGVTTLADGPGGSDRQVEDLERLLAGDQPLRDELAARRRGLDNDIAELRRITGETEAEITRISENRSRLYADGVVTELERQLLAQPSGIPQLAERLRADFAELEKLETERERLVGLLGAAPPGLPQAFALPGPRRRETAGPAELSDKEVKAAEAAAREVEAIAAASQDRLADLTLSRVELIDREEGQALAELRRLGETRGVDAAEVEAAILATQEAAAAERHGLRVEGLAREHDALVASLAAGTEARRKAVEREAGALAEIESREIDLGIVGEYEAAIIAADRWRDATLADLDTVGDGHEKLRDRALAVHARMVERAREAAQEQAAAGKGWIDGARKALGELGQETDWADTAERTTKRAFASMEDALVEFVTTGKLSFSDLANSILADLARIAIQQAITIPLANALFSAFGPAPGAPTTGGGFGNATPPPVGYYPVGHAGLLAGRSGGVRRLVPPAIFAEAQRYHSGGIAGLRPDGGIAGLRPDEVPIIAERGETVLPRGASIAMPPIEINFHNEGTPQRETRREVRLDPGRMVVAIFTDDWQKRGPIRRTIESDPPGGGQA